MTRPTADITHDLLVTDIVTKDYRTADVFRKYNIDFCCGGKMPLGMACELKGLNESELADELMHAESIFQVAKSWPLDFTVDFLVNVHHNYFKNNIEIVKEYVDRFIMSHIKKFPELEELPTLTQELFNALYQLVQYEAESLLPYTRKIFYAHSNNETYGGLFVKALSKSSAGELVKYHSYLMHLLTEIKAITHDFQLPQKACTTHQVMLQKLREFTGYTYQHITIEARVLIPAISQIEASLVDTRADL